MAKHAFILAAAALFAGATLSPAAIAAAPAAERTGVTVVQAEAGALLLAQMPEDKSGKGKGKAKKTKGDGKKKGGDVKGKKGAPGDIKGKKTKGEGKKKAG